MTKESFCIVNDTFPEDTPRGSLRGKNFGYAQICRASLLSFPCCNMHYVIKISEILRNGLCKTMESLSIVIVEYVSEHRMARGYSREGQTNVSFVSANESLFLLKGHATKYFINFFQKLYLFNLYIFSRK